MLGRHQRRRANIETIFGQRLVFAGWTQAVMSESIHTMNVAAYDMYIIDPTLIHIVIKKILNKSGRTAL